MPLTTHGSSTWCAYTPVPHHYGQIAPLMTPLLVYLISLHSCASWALQLAPGAFHDPLFILSRLLHLKFCQHLHCRPAPSPGALFHWVPSAHIASWPSVPLHHSFLGLCMSPVACKRAIDPAALHFLWGPLSHGLKVEAGNKEWTKYLSTFIAAATTHWVTPPPFSSVKKRMLR